MNTDHQDAPKKIDRFAVLNGQLSEVSGLTTDPQIRQLSAMLRAAIEQIEKPPMMTLHGFTCVCGQYTGITMAGDFEIEVEFDCAGCERTWKVSA